MAMRETVVCSRPVRWVLAQIEKAVIYRRVQPAICQFSQMMDRENRGLVTHTLPDCEMIIKYLHEKKE